MGTCLRHQNNNRSYLPGWSEPDHGTQKARKAHRTNPKCGRQPRSGNALKRWEQYGAPYELLPRREELHRLLGRLTKHRSVTAVKIHNTLDKNERKKKQVNKEEWKQILAIIRAKVEENEELPVFWRAQAEIKILPKEKQGRDEGKVIEKLP